MAIYIAHTAADAGVAKSLARFLKGQSLPVRLVGVERMTMAAKQADNMILLWSRNMAARFGAMRNPRSSPSLTEQMIIVDIDGAKTPPDTVAAVDAPVERFAQRARLEVRNRVGETPQRSTIQDGG